MAEYSLKLLAAEIEFDVEDFIPLINLFIDTTDSNLLEISSGAKELDKEINENMLLRSGMRWYYHELWEIWGEYENKEVFWLDLEITDIGRIIPFIDMKMSDNRGLYNLFDITINLEDISQSSYYLNMIQRYIQKFLEDILCYI